MLQHLQEFSQKLLSQTHEIQEQVDSLNHDAKVKFGFRSVVEFLPAVEGQLCTVSKPRNRAPQCFIFICFNGFVPLGLFHSFIPIAFLHSFIPIAYSAFGFPDV